MEKLLCWDAALLKRKRLVAGYAVQGATERGKLQKGGYIFGAVIDMCMETPHTANIRLISRRIS